MVTIKVSDRGAGHLSLIDRSFTRCLSKCFTPFISVLNVSSVTDHVLPSLSLILSSMFRAPADSDVTNNFLVLLR